MAKYLLWVIIIVFYLKRYFAVKHQKVWLNFIYLYFLHNSNAVFSPFSVLNSSHLVVAFRDPVRGRRLRRCDQAVSEYSGGLQP